MLSIELLKDVQDYIIARYEETEPVLFSKERICVASVCRRARPEIAALGAGIFDEDTAALGAPVLDEEIATVSSCPQPASTPLGQILANVDASFGQILLEYIDASGMTDAEVYRKAQISRSHFNKIKNDPNYHVQKETVMAFLLALKLDFATASELLGKAGYTFTNSSKFDLIIRYCIEYGIYDVMEANQLLFSFDQKLLGAGIKE